MRNDFLFFYMRREIIVIIGAGVFIGLAIAFGFYRANYSLNNDSPGTEIETVDSGEDDGLSANRLGLSIINLDEADVITSSPFEVNGITKPGSWVAISTEEDDYILRSDEKGEFSQEIEFTGGFNTVIFAAIADNGEKIVKNLNIIYSSEFE